MSETTKVTVPGYKSYLYREVWKITQWKDGCVYKTKRLGFIHIEDSKKYPSNKYILSSISTDISSQANMTLELMR